MTNRTDTVEKYAVTRNACKLCAPLGASLAFKGVRGAVPLIHGSQGCSTYIRRYLISHFREPMDIACSNFAEETAIFGGAVNIWTALDNIRLQYAPELIGVATTCLSETIGDDVPMFLRQHAREKGWGEDAPAVVHVSTPSYRGSHMDGFHGAVRAMVETLAKKEGDGDAVPGVNLFPGMPSCADLRYLREIFDDFGLPVMILPDYAETLDGALWSEYQRIPEGGTPVLAIRNAGRALASVSLGITQAGDKSAAGFLENRFGVPGHSLGLPIGITATDELFRLMERFSGRPAPEYHLKERGRLIDSYADGHKIVAGARAVVFGEEDMAAGMAAFLCEIGVIPVLVASGAASGRMAAAVRKAVPGRHENEVSVLSGVDFLEIEKQAQTLRPDFIVGNSKGYAMARRLGVPLLRVGFPIHDRIGGPRTLHVGYRGAQVLFDRIANTLLESRQSTSQVGYSYM